MNVIQAIFFALHPGHTSGAKCDIIGKALSTNHLENIFPMRGNQWWGKPFTGKKSSSPPSCSFHNKRVLPSPSTDSFYTRSGT